MSPIGNNIRQHRIVVQCHHLRCLCQSLTQPCTIASHDQTARLHKPNTSTTSDTSTTLRAKKSYSCVHPSNKWHRRPLHRSRVVHYDHYPYLARGPTRDIRLLRFYRKATVKAKSLGAATLPTHFSGDQPR